jgi:hypothetical protein
MAGPSLPPDRRRTPTDVENRDPHSSSRVSGGREAARSKEDGMQYMLLIYGDEAAWNALSPDEQRAQVQAYADYSQWLVDRGWMRSGEPLHDTAQATTVRVRDGEMLTTDGPFAETKEQLGGFYLIECDDLDQAIEAAARVPSARDGSIEIRPVGAMDAPDGHESH